MSFILLFGVAIGATLGAVEILNRRAGGPANAGMVGPAEAAAPSGTVENATARNVSPNGVTFGPANGPLIRREANLPPTPAKPVEPLRLHKPVVVDAGQIKAGKTSILLEDVVAPAAGEVCDDGRGGKWACGQRAAAALRLYLRGRAVECDPVGDPEQKPKGAKAEPAALAGRCRVGGADLAAWLVRNGWAKPKGAAHGKDAEAARNAKSGLWSNGVMAAAR